MQNNFFKDDFIKNAQPDNFTRYANLFAEQFLPIINNDKSKFKEIISEVEHKSWRFYNREIRKACDQYCTDNSIMDHAAFQEKWFYEGKMIGRVSHGAKAAWLDGSETVKATKAVKETPKALPKGRTVVADLADTTITKGQKTVFPYIKDGWMRFKDGAYRIGIPTAEELAKNG